MKHAIAFVTIVCGALLMFGGLVHRGDRLTLRTLAEPRLVTVIVGLPDVDARYRWLSVYGCSAEVGEHGAFCTGDFERESTQELADRKQYLIAWRDMPRGTLLITAMAFDADQRTLAANRTVVFRGQ